MPVVTTTIPESSLPQALADPNRITTEYESYTLIPRLGPLSYFQARKAVWNRLRDLNATLRLLDLAKRHQTRFARLPTIDERVLTQAYNLGFATNLRILDRTPDDVLQPREITLQTDGLLTAFRGLQEETVTAVSGKRAVNTAPAPVANRIEAESGQEILAFLKAPNAVVNRLVQSDRLLDKAGAFQKKILDLDATKQAITLLDSLDEVVKPQGGIYEAIAETMLQTAIPKTGAKHLRRLGDVVRADDALRERLRKNIAGMLAESRQFNRIKSLDDAPIVESREWAYLRREEVQMDFGTPGAGCAELCRAEQ